MREDIMVMLRMLTITQCDDEMLCPVCDSVLTDSVEQYLLRCEALLPERSVMIDEFLDNVSVEAESRIMYMDNNDLLQLMLGKDWDGYTDDERLSSCAIIAKHIKTITTTIGI